MDSKYRMSIMPTRAAWLGQLGPVYKQVSQAGYPITRVNFTSFTDVFRHKWHSL